MGWKSGSLAPTIDFLMSAPARPQMSTDKAEVAAARGARTCSVEMMDQLKCGGRPQRPLAAAERSWDRAPSRRPASPLPAMLASRSGIQTRGFPNHAPIVIDAQNGKLIECRP
jgi:hypothetical protein